MRKMRLPQNFGLKNRAEALSFWRAGAGFELAVLTGNSVAAPFRTNSASFSIRASKLRTRTAIEGLHVVATRDHATTGRSTSRGRLKVISIDGAAERSFSAKSWQVHWLLLIKIET